MMKPFVLAAVAAVSGLVLAITDAQAWGFGPGYGHNGYYGAGPYDADADGHFGFNASFSGRGHGNGAHRYAAWRGYPAYPALLPPQPTGGGWILRGVNFKYDSAELTPESKQILNTVAGTLRANPQQALEVGGHASAEGTGPYNLDLSTRRARAVRDYLVEQGVASDLLTFRGHGESRPLAPNATEPGRILNRRVELTPIMRPPQQGPVQQAGAYIQ